MQRPKPAEDQDFIEQIDANLSTYARDAGQRAHERVLHKRGVLTEVQNGFLVVQRRGGSVERVRKLPEPVPTRAGTILKRRTVKPTPGA